MAKFDIDIPKTEKAISKFESVEKTIIQSVVQMSDAAKVLKNMDPAFKDVAEYLTKVGQSAMKQAEDAVQLQGTLTLIKRKYPFTEMKIIGLMELLSEDKLKVMGAVKSGSATYEKDGVTFRADGSVLNGEAGFKREGLHVEAYAKGSALEGSASAESEYAKVSVSGSAANVEASAKIGLGTDQNWDEDGTASYMMAGAEVSASANAAQASIDSQVGTDDYNIHSNAEGSVVGADASAKAGIYMENGEIQAKAKAEAEAYWAKGEVSSGFTIAGIKVDFTVEGMVGVQAEAGASVSSGGVSGDLGLGPIGLKIKIDWSDLF